MDAWYRPVEINDRSVAEMAFLISFFLSPQRLAREALAVARMEVANVLTCRAQFATSAPLLFMQPKQEPFSEAQGPQPGLSSLAAAFQAPLLVPGGSQGGPVGVSQGVAQTAQQTLQLASYQAQQLAQQMAQQAGERAQQEQLTKQARRAEQAGQRLADRGQGHPNSQPFRRPGLSSPVQRALASMNDPRPNRNTVCTSAC